MATLITLVDGQVATVAPVNGNFAALNTEIAALDTQVSTGTADQVYRIPHAGGAGAFGNLHSSALMSLGTGVSTGRLLATGYVNSTPEQNTGTGVTNLHSWICAANTFPASDGDGCFIRSQGRFATNGNTKQLVLWVGNAGTSDFVLLNPTTTAPNAKSWWCDLILMTDGSGTFALSGIVTLSGFLGTSPTLEMAGNLGGGYTIGESSLSQTIVFTGLGGATGDIAQDITVIVPFRKPS